MKRFSKKSVAFFFLTIALCGFFSFSSFGVAKAENQTNPTPTCNISNGPPMSITCTALTGTQYSYQKAGIWGAVGGSGNNYTQSTLLNTDLFPNGTPQNIIDAEKQFDANPANNVAANTALNSAQAAATPHGFWYYAWPGNWGATITQASLLAVEYWLELWLIPLASFCLTIAGNILDIALKYSVYGGAINAFQPMIQQVWTIARDTCNVFFIFILLYIAIRQIIGQIGAELKKNLASIIIAALFINFSLFFTGLIIDAGNLVATALLNQITKVALTLPQGNVVAQASNAITNGATSLIVAGTPLQNNTASDPQISSRIMNGLGLSTVYQVGNVATFDGINTGILITSTLKLILFLVVLFVFIFMAFLLIGRLVVLIFLMATSPLGFMGGTMPFLEKTVKGWWNELFNQTLVAPVFIFCMYLVVLVMQAMQNSSILSTVVNSQSSTVSGASAQSNTFLTQGMTVWFVYIFIIYLLIQVVKITKDLSGKIGEMASGAATAATGLTFGAVTGSTALLARQTVGRGAAAIAESDRMKKLSTADSKENLQGKGFAARMGLRTLAVGSRLGMKGAVKTSEGSLDIARGAPQGKIVTDLLKGEGINITGDFAKGAQGGFVGGRKRAVEAEASFAKKLERKDLTEEQAAKEFKTKLDQDKIELDEKEAAMRSAQNDYVEKRINGIYDTYTQAQKDAIDANIDKLKKDFGKANQAYKVAEALNKDASVTDIYGNFTKEALDARKKILQQQKTVLQSAYAGIVENSASAQFWGYNKAAADEIRKKVVGGKSPEMQMAEAFAAWQKNNPGATTTGTSTPPPPGPATPPAGGPI